MVTIQLQPFFILREFGSQKFLPDRNLALEYHYQAEQAGAELGQAQIPTGICLYFD